MVYSYVSNFWIWTKPPIPTVSDFVQAQQKKFDEQVGSVVGSPYSANKSWAFGYGFWLGQNTDEWLFREPFFCGGRYTIYIRPKQGLCQGISPQNLALKSGFICFSASIWGSWNSIGMDFREYEDYVRRLCQIMWEYTWNSILTESVLFLCVHEKVMPLGKPLLLGSNRPRSQGVEPWILKKSMGWMTLSHPTWPWHINIFGM